MTEVPGIDKNLKKCSEKKIYGQELILPVSYRS